MAPACAGDHAKSKWGYLTGDVRHYLTHILMEALTKTDMFIGNWRHEDSVVEYSIAVHGDPLSVTAIDTNDGEEIRIDDVQFNGSELRCTSFCQSNSYRLQHIFRPAEGGNEIEHEYIRIEKWHRVKPTE